jgi:hypothetical protein
MDKKSTKQWLKSTSKAIREARSQFKQEQRENGGLVSYPTRGNLANLRWEYRHRHIAYSLFLGKTYEQIERKVEKGNEPDQDLIKAYLAELQAPASESEAVNA